MKILALTFTILLLSANQSQASLADALNQSAHDTLKLTDSFNKNLKTKKAPKTKQVRKFNIDNGSSFAMGRKTR